MTTIHTRQMQLTKMPIWKQTPIMINFLKGPTHWSKSKNVHDHGSKLQLPK